LIPASRIPDDDLQSLQFGRWFEIMLMKHITSAITALAMHSVALAAEAPTTEPSCAYQAVEGGVEIRDGSGGFSRPLHSSVERPWRMTAWAGDRPEFMLMRISATKSMAMLANVKLV
jgi:hypothetical protein